MNVRFALLFLIACLAVAAVIDRESGRNALDQAIEQALKAKTYGKAFLILEEALENHGNAPNANDARILLRECREEKEQAERGLVRVGSRWITWNDVMMSCDSDLHLNHLDAQPQ
jgi:hypothetical protein